MLVWILWDSWSIAETKKLTWSGNAAGYKIYWGEYSRFDIDSIYQHNIVYTKPRGYQYVIDAQNVHQFILEIPDSVKLYFAVTAYDTVGNESTYSNEVCNMDSNDYALEGDFNLDDWVDYDDLNYLLYEGIPYQKKECDLTEDNWVDFLDLNRFLYVCFGKSKKD